MARYNSNYALSSSFGCDMPDPTNNPLSYCVMGDNVNNMFLHGGYVRGQNFPRGKNCQAFMSDYCAQNWDSFCEIAVADTNTYWPNNIDTNSPAGLTQGEILIRNTCMKKYMIPSACCEPSYAPFDPLVVSSPAIRFFCNCDGCKPMYAVDPATIDQDIVMNKLLNCPHAGRDILVNIYETMKLQGTLPKLQGTHLGQYFMSLPFMHDLARYQNRPWKP